MSRSKVMHRCMLLLSFSLLLATSCKNEDNKKNSGEQTLSDSSKATPPKAAFTGGTLDTLWIASGNFASKPEKIIFSVTIDANDHLNIHGWNVKAGANQFDTDPNYKLSIGKASTLKYGPDMYFGNMVLQQSDVNKIIQKINQGRYEYVVFAPTIINNNHIGYQIFVSHNSPALTGNVLSIDPTGTDLNPSPPKNY
jgi:hypothetical protein